MNLRTALRTTAAVAAVALAATACSTTVEPAVDPLPSDTVAPSEAATPSELVEVAIVSHDSFVFPEALIAQLADEGIEVVLLRGGDAGAVLNQAILSAGNPQGDVFFGIDSTLLTRGLDAGIFEPYEAAALDAIDDALKLDPDHRVTPIDVSDVCINFDRSAYGDQLPVPSSLDDLIDPAYAGQLVVENPATSSPGLAFLLRTIAEYGEEGWQSYWQSLVDNDVAIAAGWEDAYYGSFSGGAGEGDRPLVVSYSTSPPAEVLYGPDPEADVAPTGSVIDTCYRQVEFAGVLAGTDVPAEARRVIEFMVSPAFQAEVPLNMFVEPARNDVELPELFVKFAERPEVVTELDPALVDANRERWVQEWTELVLQ